MPAPATGDIIGKEGHKFQLTTCLVSRVIAEDDIYERITTWTATAVTNPGTRPTEPKKKACIVRIFDEHSTPLADAEPGDVRAWEDELMLAQHLSKALCKCVLTPLPPKKVRKQEDEFKRTILVYHALGDDDDWIALTPASLNNQYEHVKKALMDAIQALFARGYFIAYDDYSQVLWSSVQRRCIFLNLALARKVPESASTESFEPEYELAAWAFPTQGECSTP